MRAACRIAANVLDRLAKAVAPGVSTAELDELGRDLIAEYGARSACYQYRGPVCPFPAYTCLSVNDEIVHGIGRPDRKLQPGDNISVDVCIEYEGFIGDNARTVPVGPVSEQMQYLLDSTQGALYAAISQARAGHRVGDLSHAVESFIRPRKLAIVREFVGHGVGRSMHERPQIPNYGPAGRGDELRPGVTIAIEPMINLGRPEVEMASDGWTALTRDRQPSAHFEHTVLVTEGEPEILTIAKN